MKSVLGFLKKETVFVISVILAVASMFFVYPSLNYVNYIDFRVLALLFSLMFIIAGLRKQGIFSRLARKMTKNVKSVKVLELILVLLPFFTSMLITNDVALITFVPFALALLEAAGLKKRAIRVVVLQTIGANLGSMLTPIGNPQNLYIYSLSNMGIGEFFIKMLPLTAVSLLLLIAMVFCGKKAVIEVTFENTEEKINKPKLIVTALLFVLCMGTIIRLVPWYVSLGAVVVVGLILFRDLFKEVDYFLLGTFCAFFIFVGNMQNIPAVSEMLGKVIKGNEMPIALLLSQVISNVPAAMLLSGFTDEYTQLLYGVDIGGLGTLIASLASLISYKFYAASKDARKLKYVAVFTLYNIIFLAALAVFYSLTAK